MRAALPAFLPLPAPLAACKHPPQTTGTPAPDSAPALPHTLTPTPIALEAQDVIIRDGVRDRAPAYPVNLQILPAGHSQPRVFVVQRRRVKLSEWAYDPNPDTASFLHPLSVRPVIGLPWSEENEALFAALGPGSTFRLRLNTGAVQLFRFAAKAQVSRSDTTAFRQVEPGLVLVLIGEHDAHGAPTATRWLVLATYPPAQELTRGDVLAAAPPDSPTTDLTPTFPAPTVTPLPARDMLHVEIVTVETTPGRFTARLRLYNGQSVPVNIRPQEIALALGYAPQPPGPWAPADGLEPLTLLPGQAADLALYWPWADEPYALLRVGVYRYAIQCR